MVNLETWAPVLVALAVTLPIELYVVSRVLKVPAQTRDMVRRELDSGAWDEPALRMFERVAERRIGRAVLAPLRGLLGSDGERNPSEGRQP